jgi:hypothetical protein
LQLFEKKCSEILVLQKKAVLLHPLSEKTKRMVLIFQKCEIWQKCYPIDFQGVTKKMQKKCKKILVVQKKAVPLQPISR